MNLKTKCDEFLQSVTIMRQAAINEAVQREIQTQHEPYKAQMISARDKALANEEQSFTALVNQITAEHNAKVQTCKADFEKAIQAHRDEVARNAEQSAKVEYDKFILAVSAVADEIKVN